MTKPDSKLKEEFLKMLPPMAYFFVALHLVLFIRVLSLEGSGISPFSSLSIAVTSLVLAKAVLIADMLPAINRFPEKPLIYNISWKTAIYMLVATLIHYLERQLDLWEHGGGLVAGNEKLLRTIVWPHFWAIEIALFLLVGIYCVVTELARVVGKEKMLRIFFGERLGSRKAESARGT